MTLDIEQFVAEQLARSVDSDLDRALAGPFTSSDANTSRPTLTARELIGIVNSVMSLPQIPSTAFDIYGSPGLTEAHEVQVEKMPTELRPPGSKGRRLLVVPKDELESWADRLRKAGADVRVEPRYGRAPEIVADEDGAAL